MSSSELPTRYREVILDSITPDVRTRCPEMFLLESPLRMREHDSVEIVLSPVYRIAR